MRLLISFVFFFSAAQAYAVIGDSIQLAGPQAMCRLLLRTNEGKLIGTCSGTLISPTIILSAAHCVNEFDRAIQNLTIECGYLGVSKELKEETTSHGNLIYTIGVQFSETLTARQLYFDPGYPADAAKDTALIVLENPSRLKPVPLVEESKFLALFTKKPKTCLVGGFGIGPDGKGGLPYLGLVDEKPEFSPGHLSGRKGILLMDQKELLKDLVALPKMNPNDTLKARLALLAKHKLVRSIHMPGDSGGPLFCRESATSPWSLVAVNSQTGYELIREPLPALTVEVEWATIELKNITGVPGLN